MFLGRSESIKWIRRKFSKRNNSNSATNEEHTPAKQPKNNNETTENIRDLNEILIISNLENTIIAEPKNHCTNLATTPNSNEVMSTTSPTQHTAPIAREEDAEEENEETFENNNDSNETETIDLEESKEEIINEINNVRRSKTSRVRNYLKKCKDRWLAVGLHNHPMQEHNNTGHDLKPTMSTIHELDVSQQDDLRPTARVTVTSTGLSCLGGGDSADADAGASAVEGSLISCALGNLEEIADDDDDVVDDSYEDIDFGLGSTKPTTTALRQTDKISTRNSNNNFCNSDTNAQMLVTRQEQLQLKSLAQHQHDDVANEDEKHVDQLLESLQMDSHIASLIDSHLACIYPVFTQTTRAVLIREARDVLVNTYHGCLTTFERQFLCKFTEIAVILKERHHVGEALIWCQGWPLVTPIGEVILHLGGLDDDQVKSAEIYLCVKTVETIKEPQLYAIWRTPTENPTTNTQRTTLESGSILKSCQLDYQDHTLYLSTLALEMLSDDLPQLLQNLLIGVEHSLERLSLNQLQQIPYHGENIGDLTTTTTTTSSSVTAEQQNNNKHNISTSRTLILNSPKCPLRRSELITKNYVHNSKYMLRRLTNRQDSMNSTSSGNSSASGLSTASSDSDSFTKSHLNSNNAKNINNIINNTNKISHNITATTPSTTATKPNEPNSPALPRFCLGNSFPHIDSDEEITDDKRNSLTDDQLESEIVPPNCITDLPEKLLLSGIYLTGSRDLKGNPLVTVDAESVVAAGLNCYEIATLLLYYSTIPESSMLTSSNNLNGQTISATAQRSPAIQLTTSQYATTTIQPSTMEAVTTATTPTCTSLNDNIEQQQSEQFPKKQNQQTQVTFTILIAIEKLQHLCVIDLISQSLKLLTRHIAYSELLVVCLDNNLLQSSNKYTNSVGDGDQNDSTIPNKFVGVGVDGAADIKETEKSCDSNGNHCKKKLPRYPITFISIDEVTTSVAPSQVPSGRLGGLHHHDARKWRDFFMQFEPFYNQCTGAAQRLVAALNDIRYADLQGLPTRRQLYAQHRALSRALMDSELHNLRKRSTATMARLQDLAKSINQNSNNSYRCLKTTTPNFSGSCGIGSSFYSGSSSGSLLNRNKIMGSGCSSYSFNYQSQHNNSQISHNFSTIATTITTPTKSSTSTTAVQSQITTTNPIIKSSIYSANSQTSATANRVSANYSSNNNNIIPSPIVSQSSNIDVAIRLQKVTLLFSEIDRAAKRLEQLTEQRREHLRELTRQRALEDEINEVTSWITNDGSESLQRFINVELDLETSMKEREHEFEKYYFISMKHLAKGRDLHLAAASMDSLKESSINLKQALDGFAEKLENAREHVEGATRLYHLLNLHMLDENMQHEMERLAGLYGVKGLLEKYREKENERFKPKPNSLHLNFNHNLIPNKSTNKSQMITSTPATHKLHVASHRSSYGTGSYESSTCHCWRDSRNLDDMDEMLDNDEEEKQSKVADSGVGECQRCEGNPKLTRVCSCQSLNEESEDLYEKHDELDDECFEQPSKHYMNIHSPLEANKHLQYFASTFELPNLEELSCLDPKIQKTLLLIMREMIGTERDYVRSLYYVIENYIDELLRDDIPQSLRGQRNVIFGNIEKIFEFHNNHFLTELERYEHNPLKVGAAFLHMESKFYLYALYNKNKPKSDTLMSEYGTSFFKSKQFELKDKMDLASYLLKPVQRMGKYALLLQQLVKACSTVQGSALQEISADVEELQKAEEMVKFQLRHGNDLLAMDSLRDCDVNVKEQGRLVRQNEFLVWQGRGGKKTLRQIFLFEELVLFSKARRFPDHKNLDLYIYKNSIKTSDIGLTAHVGDSPTKFEIWFRKRKPEDTFTLQCMSEDIKNAWTEEISKLLWQQAKRNREIRLAEMSSMGIGSKPCLDIRPSHNQINDRSITINQLGKTPKLRHSFVGVHTEQITTSRRPTSLISESSLSSGTSSSSLSKSSTTSSSSSSAHQHYQHHTNQGLELINECQTLALENSESNKTQHMTNTLSSDFSSQSGGTLNARYTRNYHKRSTTIVSQLSMAVKTQNPGTFSDNKVIITAALKKSANLDRCPKKEWETKMDKESGIMSDISMTPDQDSNEMLTPWPNNPTDAIMPPTNNGDSKFILKCHSTNTLGKSLENHHTNHQCKELKAEEMEEQQS